MVKGQGEPIARGSSPVFDVSVKSVKSRLALDKASVIVVEVSCCNRQLANLAHPLPLDSVATALMPRFGASVCKYKVLLSQVYSVLASDTGFSLATQMPVVGTATPSHGSLPIPSS